MNKLLFISIITILFSSSIGAEQDMKVLEAPTFIIGVDDTEYYPMYGYQDGNYVGFARELLDAFASDSGYSFQYRPFPILRLYKEFLVNRTVDFKYPDNTFWKSDLKKGKQIHYSTPVVEYIDGVMVLPENKGRGIGSFKSLGTVLGFTPWEYLEAIQTGKIKEDSTTTYRGIIKKTIAKRIDGAYSCIAVLKYQLENMNMQGALVFDPSLPHTQSSYRLSSIKHPDIIQKFSFWLVKRKAFIDKLKEKYHVGVTPPDWFKKYP